MYAFTAALWLWDERRADTWTFVTVPHDISAEIADRPGPRTGFGSVRVEVGIAEVRWRTSLFPDAKSQCYVLPVKRPVRKALGIEDGDEVEVRIELL